jgi:hypothetical protein
MYFLLAVGSDRFMKPLKWKPLKVLLQSDKYTHLTLVFMPFINLFVSLVSKPKVLKPGAGKCRRRSKTS